MFVSLINDARVILIDLMKKKFEFFSVSAAFLA